MRARRPIWLVGFALWVLCLGVIGGWRGITLWRERALLYELGSSLSPTALTFFVGLFLLCGFGLTCSGLGLWWRKAWARMVACICIPLHAVVFQAYTWLFVRSGLMWDRRWASAAASVLAVVIGIGALTWPRCQKWLDLG